MPKTRSLIHNYFSRNEGGNSANCSFCNARILTKDGSTSARWHHLRSVHPEIYKEDIHLRREEHKAADKGQMQPVPVRQVRREDAKQRKVISSFVKSATVDATDVDDAIAEMIVLDGWSFRMVENAGFMNLIRKMRLQDYQLKDGKFYERSFRERHDRLKTRMKEVVLENAAGGLCLGVDLSSDEEGLLLCCSAHFLTDDWQQKTMVLHVQRLTRADDLSEMLDRILDDWEIKREQVHLVLRGDDESQADALEGLGLPSVICISDALNAVISQGIDKNDNVKKVVATCRRISEGFDSHESGKSHSEKLQERRSRWTASYYSMKAINSPSRKMHLFSLCYGVDVRTANWKLIPRILECLKPFESLAAALSSSSSQTTIADIIPRLRWLMNLVGKIEAQVGVRSFAKTLRDGLAEQISSMEKRSCYYLATILDPRYKDRLFEGTVTANVAKQDLENLVSVEVAGKMGKEGRKTNGSDFGSWSSFVQGYRETKVETETAGKVKEVDQYLQERSLDCTCNPLDWWEENRSRYPHLARLARQFLSVPPTNIRSEELFGDAGDVYKPNHKNYGEFIEKLLFFKFNAKFI